MVDSLDILNEASFLRDASDLWVRIFIFDFGRYFITAAMVTLAILVLRPLLKHRKIQNSRAGLADYGREIFYSTLTAAVFALTGSILNLGAKAGIVPLIFDPLPSFWLGALEFGALTLFHDAYFYWAHRAMHHPKLYRVFHHVHHKSRTPTPWAAYAFALPEAFVENIFFPLYVLLVPTHTTVIFVFLMHMILRNAVGHSGYELFPRGWLDKPWLSWITTTTHHDLHHSTFNHNYGLYFRWWDQWMGTEHPQYKTRFDAITAKSGTIPLLSPGE